MYSSIHMEHSQIDYVLSVFSPKYCNMRWHYFIRIEIKFMQEQPQIRNKNTNKINVKTA